MNKKQITFFAICCLATSMCSTAAFAKHDHHEKYYQEQWCQDRGQVEFVLPDRTRVDCLTETHAVEHDFGQKWAEAIGQSLYYSFQTGKRAGIVLILEKESDRRYWIRLNSTIKHFKLPIDTCVIGAGADEKYTGDLM